MDAAAAWLWTYMQPACILGEVTTLELCLTYPFWLEAETMCRIFYRHAETSDSLSSMCRCGEQRQQADGRVIPCCEKRIRGGHVGLASRIEGAAP